MSTPESPLEKKESTLEKELTLSERVDRLEYVLESAYNQLGKHVQETELKLQKESQTLQEELSKTLQLMNMSTLQNIIAIKETIKVLIGKELVDQAALDAAITEEFKKAIEAQQKVISEAHAAYQAKEAQEAQETVKTEF